MKWLSIKKYLPPSGTYVFVRAVNTLFNSEYCRHFVCMTEDYTRMECLDDWQAELGFNNDDINPKTYRVTHFAIIDAVEID